MYNDYLILGETACFAITCTFWCTLFSFVRFKCSATSNACNDQSDYGKW